jgi:hypothetical protein
VSDLAGINLGVLNRRIEGKTDAYKETESPFVFDAPYLVFVAGLSVTDPGSCNEYSIPASTRIDCKFLENKVFTIKRRQMVKLRIFNFQLLKRELKLIVYLEMCNKHNDYPFNHNFIDEMPIKNPTRPPD